MLASLRCYIKIRLELGSLVHLRALMHCRGLLVLAGAMGLMCSAEVFEFCHPHLRFGKRSW